MPGSTTDRIARRGRHHRSGRYRPRHHLADATRSTRRFGFRRTSAAIVLMSIAMVALSITARQDAGPGPSSPTAEVAVLGLSRLDRQHDEASRSGDRSTPQPTPAVSGTAAASPSAVPSPSPSATGSPSPSAAASPLPVGGLTQTQMNYAAVIVRVGKQLLLPARAYVVAVATALQESRLLNLANWAVAESLNLAHDGVGGDHDSVGLFQQRPSSGWGTVAELLDPATAARKFYLALTEVAGWQELSVAAAAQAVQVSAFPYAYAQQETLATAIVTALN